jgi:tetratricopeptide (TPR) repeat protein
LDPDKKIAGAIKNSLDTLGIPETNISITKTHEETIKILHEIKPAYLACYFNPEDKNIFKILDEHKKIIPNPSERYCLAFSQTKAINTFAQALEEDIDDYIVEPYGQTKIVEKIQKVVKTKLNPTPYKFMLNKINNLILEGELKPAQVNCQNALVMHPRPSMVYYYLAQIKIAEKENTVATKYLIEGLKFNKEHYKCLMLLHELYYKQGNYDRAYKVLRKVLDRFPLSMNRMFDVFRLGIASGHFQEIEDYCRKILRNEENDLPVLRFCTAGLTVCSMFTLGKNENKGIELLKETLKYSKSDPKILRNIYKCYLTFGLMKNAQNILTIFKKDHRSGLEFKSCIYLQEIHSTRPINLMVEEAKNRLTEVQFDQDCYDDLLKRTLKEGTQKHIETLQSMGQNG